jgi:hypothetical protein
VVQNKGGNNINNRVRHMGIKKIAKLGVWDAPTVGKNWSAGGVGAGEGVWYMEYL